MPSRPTVFYLADSGRETAFRINEFVGGEIRSYRELRDKGVAVHLREKFAAGVPIIGVCAAGILIRSVAPLLRDKMAEPPVLAVAEDASSIVPLLGGHRGANALAQTLSEKLESHAAITTASELAFGVALDNPPPGWRLEDQIPVKSAISSILSGAPTCVSGNADWISPLYNLPNVKRISTDEPDAPVVVFAADSAPLVYRRASFALGVGCSRYCPPDDLIGLVRATLAECGRSEFEIAGIYSIDKKSDEAAVHMLAREFKVPSRFFSAAILRAETHRLADPSARVFSEVGVHGVCEAAALAAAGPNGSLEITKRKSANATCALARIGGTDGYAGRPRGRLAIVGIGPGSASTRTAEASLALAQADEIVGYHYYLELIDIEFGGVNKRAFKIGEEERRCRYALEKAGEGLNVVLVCSGDAGIYAMGALVLELLDRVESDGGVSGAARRVQLVCVPGVSAMQAAAARAGALLGHDFCAISLSDLLTPKAEILKKIDAAATGDFVVAFYNPVSARRRTLLDLAKQILLKSRNPETPVLVARNICREDESLTYRHLADLETSDADMMTVILVGNSRSKAFRTGDTNTGVDGRLMYTPRGYGRDIRRGTVE